MVSIAFLGMLNPASTPVLVALAALIVSTCSASQDIVIDAYRIEILKPEQYGAGAANAVLGYRIGMIASTAGALYLAEATSWVFTYICMAGLMGIGIITALLAGEPEGINRPAIHTRNMRTWINDYVISPLREFAERDHWLTILLFIVLYKLADGFIGVMTNAFLIQIGFLKSEIATVAKLYGLIASIAGTFAGGWIVYRLGTLRTLWLCGIGQGATNLLFILQAQAGADIDVLKFVNSTENFVGGMGTAAFVAFMSSLCNVRFTATQYALLSSLAAFGRTWLSTPSGWMVDAFGWSFFFAFGGLLAIPGLFVLWWLSRRISFTAISPRAASTSE